MNYEDPGGPGIPIVALHGTFGRGKTFAAVTRALSPDYRVIAPDLRGHARTRTQRTASTPQPTTSPRAAWDGDFGREAFVGDVAAFIEGLGLAPALVVGHSLGGVTAYQLAARRPELVRALVVEDVCAVPGDAVLDVTGWPRRFSDRAAAERFFAATPAPEYFLESVGDDGELLFNPGDMMAVQRGNAGDWWDDWLAVTQPTLLLRATNSFLLDAAQAAEMIRRRPATELVTFDGTGHWIHREAPDAYAEAVRGFFRNYGLLG